MSPTDIPEDKNIKKYFDVLPSPKPNRFFVEKLEVQLRQKAASMNAKKHQGWQLVWNWELGLALASFVLVAVLGVTILYSQTFRTEFEKYMKQTTYSARSDEATLTLAIDNPDNVMIFVYSKSQPNIPLKVATRKVEKGIALDLKSGEYNLKVLSQEGDIVFDTQLSVDPKVQKSIDMSIK